MTYKDKHPKPYITISNDLSITGKIIDKKEGKYIKILESPFSDSDNEDGGNLE